MVTACPHCQFLVARDPHTGAPPEDCPRCGKSLATTESIAATPAPSLATLLNTASAMPAQDAGEPRAVEDDAVIEQPVVSEDARAAPPDPAEEPSTPPDSERDAVDVDTAKDDTLAGVDVATLDTSDSEPTDAVSPRPVPARKANGPRFLSPPRTTPVHARRARWQWVTVAALGAVLCVQVVMADRARLATQAGWRPVVVALCGIFRCDVPVWREPAAFSMLSRDVRPVPGAPGTLQAQATFRNEARWPQAWPVILLTLKDADGRTLGARALRPDDYLPQGETLTAIEPGQSAQMAVRLREPSASVVAFSFDFR